MAVMAALHLQMRSEFDHLLLQLACIVKAKLLDVGLKVDGILCFSKTLTMHYLQLMGK